MALMREETFGPALPIMPFDDEQQALALAADSDFALNAGIWTGAPSRGARLASHLRCGNVFVNNVLTNAGHPALPFGGARQSGFGRYHGPEGLLTFVQPKSVLIQKHAARREFNWLPYDNLPELTAELIRLRYGHMPRLQRWRRWLSFGRNARKRLDYLARIKLWQREPDAGEANE
jgi:delta 1-pyrroline-5-carboxylate dehydrogenase